MNHLHSRIFKLFKAGVVNFDNTGTRDIGYIATEDLTEFAKKWEGQLFFKNGHFEDTAENRKNEIVGKISETWVEGEWVVGTGLIDDEGLDLLQNGKSVSVTFLVSNKIQNNVRDKKEGFEYHYRVLDMIPDHIAIVDNPRYEGAGLKHNSLSDTIICNMHLKENKEKSIDNLNSSDSNLTGNKPLTKLFDMFSIGKKHNNMHESEPKPNKHEEPKDNTSEPNEQTEKKYASFGGRKMMGYDEESFKQRATEAFSKKHNTDLSEDAEALEHIIEIEHEGEKIEMSLKEAMELIQAAEKTEEALERHEQGEINEPKHNENESNKAEEPKTESKPSTKENASKKHNSYASTVKAEYTSKSSSTQNLSPDMDYLAEKSARFDKKK